MSPAGRLAAEYALRAYARELKRNGYDGLAAELERATVTSDAATEHKRALGRERQRRYRARRALYGDRGGFASQQARAEAGP